MEGRDFAALPRNFGRSVVLQIDQPRSNQIVRVETTRLIVVGIPILPRPVLRARAFEILMYRLRLPHVVPTNDLCSGERFQTRRTMHGRYQR